MKNFTRFRFLCIFFIASLLLTANSCRKDCDDDILPPAGVDCTKLHPIIFLHGFLASGDTWANQVMRFQSNGHCENLLYAYDWNTLGGGNDNAALLAFIDREIYRSNKIRNR